MSRWSWHEKFGPRQSVVVRHSDVLTPKQEEKLQRARHQREIDWIQHGETNGNGLLYQDYRTCAYCPHKGHQVDMYWTGRRWLCAHCWAENTR